MTVMYHAPCHANVLGSGRISQCIRSLGTTRRWRSDSRHGRFKPGKSASIRWMGLYVGSTVRLDTLDKWTTTSPAWNQTTTVHSITQSLYSLSHPDCYYDIITNVTFRQNTKIGLSLWQRTPLAGTLPHHGPTSPSTEKLFKILCDSLKSVIVLLYCLCCSILFYSTGFQPFQLFGAIPIPVHARVALKKRNRINLEAGFEPATSNLC